MHFNDALADWLPNEHSRLTISKDCAELRAEAQCFNLSIPEFFILSPSSRVSRCEPTYCRHVCVGAKLWFSLTGSSDKQSCCPPILESRPRLPLPPPRQPLLPKRHFYQLPAKMIGRRPHPSLYSIPVKLRFFREPSH